MNKTEWIIDVKKTSNGVWEASIFDADDVRASRSERTKYDRLDLVSGDSREEVVASAKKRVQEEKDLRKSREEASQTIRWDENLAEVSA